MLDDTKLAKRLRQSSDTFAWLLAEAVETYATHDSWCAVATHDGWCGCGYGEWLRRVNEATGGGE